MHVVTTLTRSDRTSLGVLAEDVRRHDPDVALRALSLDGSLPPSDAAIEEIDPAMIAVQGVRFVELRAALGPDDLRSIALPLMLAAALRAGAERALYVSPDVGVYGSLRGLSVAGGVGVSAVIRAPRALPDDGLHPDTLDVLDAGVVTDSLVAATPDGIPALDHWARLALAQWVRGEPIRNADLLAFLATSDIGVHLVDEPGHLDPWRIGAMTPERAITVDFTGRRADAPHRLLPGHGRERHALIDDRALASRYEERDERTAARSGADEGQDAPAATLELVAGVPFDATMHRLYADAVRQSLAEDEPRPPGPIDDPEGFLLWCAEAEHGGPIPISRYLAGVRRSRADLLDAFQEIPGRDARALVEWARTHGRTEEHIPDRLVPGAPPPEHVRAYQQPGVNLAGFLDAELGVGEVGRRLGAAMDVACVPYGTYTFARTRSRRALAGRDDHDLRYDTNIVCVNADSIGSFVQTVGPDFFAGRHRIGVWFWETADLPRIFQPAFGNLDELWAASDFVADALRGAAPPTVTVVRFPLPIVTPTIDPEATRATLELPEHRPMFVCTFDFLSVAERKNPYGAIDAFRQAFGPDEGPVLVVKSINADKRPDEWQRLRWWARGRDDIVLRDGYLDAPLNAALLSLADCVVSLHRSEGFGFNLADAMALGTPVVATAWSGNLTFMREEDCYLVPAATKPVGDGHFPYDPGSVWADPDLDAAVSALRAIVEDPATARARAAHARARVLDDFSLLRTGEFIRNRLAGIRAERPVTSSQPGVRADAIRRLASRVLPARRV